jgi:DNA-directed RNA polymerase subunit RPC12/RpoP
MASWFLICQNCRQKFEHLQTTEINLDDFYFPEKPELPTNGNELECPHCHQKANYERTSLLYQP